MSARRRIAVALVVAFLAAAGATYVFANADRSDIEKIDEARKAFLGAQKRGQSPRPQHATGRRDKTPIGGGDAPGGNGEMNPERSSGSISGHAR